MYRKEVHLNLKIIMLDEKVLLNSAILRKLQIQKTVMELKIILNNKRKIKVKITNNLRVPPKNQR